MSDSKTLEGLKKDLRPVFSARVIVTAWLPCLAITTLHYLVPPQFAAAHDILRRMYYLPILFAAFSTGLPGAIALSVFASLSYFPHAFGGLMAHDPGGMIEKSLEIVLLNIVAVVAGLLVDRERREREKQEKLAARLSESLEDQRRMEAQLIRAGKLGALGEMTAGIAHEIKNPLHAMKGTAEIVREVTPRDIPESRMLDLLIGEIDRLGNVAERFLSFAKPAPSDRVPLDFRNVVSRVVPLVDSQARKAGIVIEPENREYKSSPVVMGDVDQLTQIFLNIALNGIQAMAPAGEGRLRFAIREERQGGRKYVTLALSNDGPPIPEDQLEKIFDPFFTTKDDGTGLGLSVCSRIADQHEGILAVRNLPGSGVEFSLTLPAV